MSNKVKKRWKNSGQVRKMLTAAGGPIKKPIKRLKDGYRYIPDEQNGGWNRISDNEMSDVFATMEFTPNKTKTGSSITRTLQPKTSNYRSAYNPDDIIKGFNALTLGGLNNLSPTQWARRYYDLNQLLVSQVPGSKRTMTWSGFVNNWLNGNNGLVSEKFAQEHPYWSMGINGVGDAVALGGLANANKVKLVGDIATKHGGDAAKIAIDVAKNSSKPFNWRNYRFLGDSRFYSDLDDTGYKTLMSERLSGNYPLTFAERKNYVTGLKSDVQKGVDYAIDEAKANLKTPLIRGKEVEYTFDGGRGWRLDPYSPEDILPQLIHYGTLKTTKEYGKTPWEGNYGAFQDKTEGLFFPFRDRPNTLRTHSMFLDAGERISTGAHETRHTIQSYFDVPLTEKRYDMPGTYGRYTNRKLPLDFKKKVNEFINDALTAGEWQGSLSEMDSELTGWSAKYGFPRYSQMNPKQKALLHDLFLRRFGGTSDYKNYGEISSLLRLNPDYNTSLLYSKMLDDSKVGQIILGLEVLGYRKNGGKMNILEFLKKGSGIHIKKKNRGKFTEYCGGTVTDECIRKAKASGNPTLVKRATFAANARKWKHLNGGILKAQFGTNLDVDNRSDTTRKGYGSMPYFGAANNSNTAGLLDLMNYNVTGNPNIITGEPVILPGRVNMSLYKDAKYLLKGPQYDEGFVNFVDRLAKGKIKPSLIGTYKEPVTKFVDLESESIPKGYVKGNEVTPDLRYPISEEGLTVRTVKPIKLENPITNEAEAAAARDWLAERLPKQLKTKPSTKPTKPAVKKEEPIVEKKGVANPKSTSTERYHDNKNYSRKIRQLDKYTRSMETEKASPSNSGNFRVRRARDEEDFNNMENYPVFRNIRKNLIKRKAKWEASGDKKAKAQWMKDYKDALEKFRKGLLSNKHGGIIKADDGTKLLKLGNTLNNSGLGEFLINGLASYKLNRAQNNYIDNYEQMLDASIEMEKTQANKLNWKEALLLSNQFLLDNYDPENPNKFGGVFAQVIPYLIYNMLNYQTDLDFRNKKVLLKSQTLALKDLNTTNFITNLGSSAISLIGNIANKKLATSA